MQLTDEQKSTVTAWIAEGLKLSDVQQRLADKFDIRLTYMEARLLVDDLRVTPKDPAPPAAPAAAASSLEASPETAAPALVTDDAPETLAPAGNVSVKVDEITRPGAMVSGSVVFSDGEKAAWYLDQYGRMGISGKEGYRPKPADVEEFQAVLDRELAKMGL